MGRFSAILFAFCIFVGSSTAYGFGIQIDPTQLSRQMEKDLEREEAGLFARLKAAWVNVRKTVREIAIPKLGDPIHEKIAKSALAANGIQMDNPTFVQYGGKPFEFDPGTEVLIGLLHNDDPDGYLFPQSPSNVKGFDTSLAGVKWATRFMEAKSLAKDYPEGVDQAKYFATEAWAAAGKPKNGMLFEKMVELEGHMQNLLYASHFGDWQYMHGMGQEHQSREQVKDLMMGYAKHCWQTATGVSDHARYETFVGGDAAMMEEYKDYRYLPWVGRLRRERRAEEERLASSYLERPSDHVRLRYNWGDLVFHTRIQSVLEYRALGSLMHMVQDSYAKGHTVRVDFEKEGPGSNSGKIRFFQNYVEQDGSLHGHYDTPADGDDSADNWAKIPGADTALERSTQLVNFFLMGCLWDDFDGKNPSVCPEGGMKNWFEDEVFALVPTEADNPSYISFKNSDGTPIREETRTRSHREIASH